MGPNDINPYTASLQDGALDTEGKEDGSFGLNQKTTIEIKDLVIQSKELAPLVAVRTDMSDSNWTHIIGNQWL